MLSILLALVSSLSLWASDLERAPQNFSYQDSQAIYVDFTSAHYLITYDVKKRVAQVEATIKFVAKDAGYPVLDFLENPSEVTLDGAASSFTTIETPDRATSLRVIGTQVGAGEHSLFIKLPLSRLLEWKSDGVHSAFWASDLRDRAYLEQYLPTNMEFDRIPMVFEVKVVGGASPHVVYANGDVEELARNHFKINFPEFYTSSSVYFHMTPKGMMTELNFEFTSIDGRILPTVIYLKPSFFNSGNAQLNKLKAMTIRIMNELEADYGPFPHESLTIYNAGQGGMEYCGATMTSERALGHELIHSYFARGVMPANGNAGWVDEAIASWRDNGYPRGRAFSGRANMAGRADYTRFTDRQAYTFGANFMASLDNHLASQGGLRPVLRKIVENHLYTPFFTEDFVQWSEGFSRQSLMPIFLRHVYGGNEFNAKNFTPMPHVHHQKMSLEELQNYL